MNIEESSQIVELSYNNICTSILNIINETDIHMSIGAVPLSFTNFTKNLILKYTEYVNSYNNLIRSNVEHVSANRKLYYNSIFGLKNEVFYVIRKIHINYSVRKDRIITILFCINCLNDIENAINVTNEHIPSITNYQENLIIHTENYYKTIINDTKLMVIKDIKNILEELKSECSHTIIDNIIIEHFLEYMEVIRMLTSLRLSEFDIIKIFVASNYTTLLYKEFLLHAKVITYL